jgi:hypothetical protein
MQKARFLLDRFFLKFWNKPGSADQFLLFSNDFQACSKSFTHETGLNCLDKTLRELGLASRDICPSANL